MTSTTSPPATARRWCCYTGFGEFWYAWRHQIPALANPSTVIAPDLRGHGYTEKPHVRYDKRTMAAEIRELLATLGQYRGARVGLRLAKDHRDFAERLAVLDNVPTRIIFEMMDGTLAKGQWRFVFNAVANLPEALIADREEIWLRHFFDQ